MSHAPLESPAPNDAERLARVRTVLAEKGDTPAAALDAIARIIGRREAPADTYQKPLG